MLLETITVGVAHDESLNRYVADRLCASFQAVEKKIRSITVRVGEQPADESSAKQFCTLIVRLNGGEIVAGADVGSELFATIDRVVGEVGQKVRRHTRSRWW